MSIRARLRRTQLRLAHRMALRRSAASLHPYDQRPIPDAPDEIRLFAKARNEATRWPRFLDHFRSLGVDRFFIVDNGSTDGFLELAAAEPDVHLFTTNQSLQHHPLWFELLLQRHGHDHWCVAADLDELLVLPEPTGTLGDLAESLEREGATALRALLLDMYPEQGVEASGYVPGDDPIALCPWFDVEFTEQPWRPVNARTQRRFSSLRYGGGCRQRVFGVDPNLTKTPFFHHGPDTWLSAGAHHIDGATMSTARGVMLHFKYLHDFTARTNDAVERAVYADAGGTYSAIANALADQNQVRLWHPHSQRLTTPEDLVGVGMLRTSDSTPVGSAMG